MTTQQRAEITTKAIERFSQDDAKYNGFIQGAEAMDNLCKKEVERLKEENEKMLKVIEKLNKQTMYNDDWQKFPDVT